MSEESLSLLVLDDDEAVRESFIDYFEDRGWEVFSEETAEDAIHLLDRHLPDCAIVDIRLPGMDGNSFLRLAKQKHPQMVSVICTGSPEYHPPRDVAGLGTVSDKVFSKPVEDLEELELTLRAQFDKYSREKQL